MICEYSFSWQHNWATWNGRRHQFLLDQKYVTLSRTIDIHQKCSVVTDEGTSRMVGRDRREGIEGRTVCPARHLVEMLPSHPRKWQEYWGLTLAMLKLHSSEAKNTQKPPKSSKPLHVGIHWIVLAECSRMSTDLSVFRSFFSFFALFCIGKICHQQQKG